jgi:hypothetical protein
MGIPLVLLGNIMDVFHIVNKGELMNTLEKFHSYNITLLDNQINDYCTAKLYVLFYMIIQNCTD